MVHAVEILLGVPILSPCPHRDCAEQLLWYLFITSYLIELNACTEGADVVCVALNIVFYSALNLDKSINYKPSFKQSSLFSDNT